MPFLTAIGQEFPSPERISGDHVLRRAAADGVRQAIHEDRRRTPAGIPLWPLTVTTALAAALATAAVFAVRHTRPRLPDVSRPSAPTG
ncbi:hypothetical protein [Streptomyces sp. bgisy027]|uniref:hypothetical protein n=1 Tax=unclassified Streptomyces TaxID=2593676 RepID=UPI003D7562FF